MEFIELMWFSLKILGLLTVVSFSASLIVIYSVVLFEWVCDKYRS